MTESQKETFRKYLEQAGAIDILVKVLVQLYDEPSKPKQSLDYIKQCLGSPTPAEYEVAVAEKEGLARQLEEANQIIAELQAKVQQLESQLANRD
mmetsp:Transcript_12679/g.22620  ORF Transcript_12679/g.22620 Transcript_12679/m.22620 type:complete len:95 (-) Transcript_12679:237-521(-)|eukprot:CAMPEP_0175073882 /NCGR_PEP_ID=MMETSP0052_2-20121109/20881_1 /TAXON_ID=51329 ORGANISM="Polytomella parva, Strain SAG 63-3" /NCGR_SAMPLE_ID=MMETSP0052_2 /ASSEMBLY_ACC=CAM_ASM_000194 /LENGTH=94 /DNA_ID=CAMNT_0016341885 /DNA_START=38 /DNA_END=322 /DNA_ORIENTATION=+